MIKKIFLESIKNNEETQNFSNQGSGLIQLKTVLNRRIDWNNPTWTQSSNPDGERRARLRITLSRRIESNRWVDSDHVAVARSSEMWICKMCIEKSVYKEYNIEFNKYII